MAKEIIISLIIIHGLIHLFGFAKGFKVKELDQFNEDVSKPYGIIWFVVYILFITSGIGLLVDQYWWVYLAFISIALSQLLIMRYWFDARTGTIINALLVVAIIIYFNVQ